MLNMSYTIVPEKESLVVLVKMLSINEVNLPSLFNLVGSKILGLEQKVDMAFRKVVVASVIFNMSILKSPIINDGFFVLDSLCSIVCIYSLKRSRLEYSSGRYITPIKSSVLISKKIYSNIPSSKNAYVSSFFDIVCVIKIDTYTTFSF